MFQSMCRDLAHHELTLTALFGDLIFSSAVESGPGVVKFGDGFKTSPQFNLEGGLTEHAKPWLWQVFEDMKLLRTTE